MCTQHLLFETRERSVRRGIDRTAGRGFVDHRFSRLHICESVLNSWEWPAVQPHSCLLFPKMFWYSHSAEFLSWRPGWMVCSRKELARFLQTAHFRGAWHVSPLCQLPRLVAFTFRADRLIRWTAARAGQNFRNVAMFWHRKNTSPF